jgi:hypothetical protein
MAEIPFLIMAEHHTGQPIAAAWSRMDADFIAHARMDGPTQRQEIHDLRGRIAEMEHDLADLRIRLATTERECVQVRPLVAVCARFLGIHGRGHDRMLPWNEMQHATESAGVTDWRNWTKW